MQCQTSRQAHGITSGSRCQGTQICGILSLSLDQWVKYMCRKPQSLPLFHYGQQNVIAPPGTPSGLRLQLLKLSIYRWVRDLLCLCWGSRAGGEGSSWEARKQRDTKLAAGNVSALLTNLLQMWLSRRKVLHWEKRLEPGNGDVHL